LLECSSSFFDYVLVLGKPKVVIGAKVYDFIAVDFCRRTVGDESSQMAI